MAERAVFLDRDNTIIEDKEGYIGDPAKVRLLPGAATAIASMRRLGYRIIVVSNQSGVARGMFDEAAVESVNQEMCRQLRDQGGAHVDASYYCPYHPDGSVPEYKMDHDWRKPKPGMLKQAGEDFGLDLSQCWMVGDALRDVECGLAARCRTILLQNPNRPPHGEDPTSLTVSPHFIVNTLADAARVIAREGRATHREATKPTEPVAAESEQPAKETAPAATKIEFTSVIPNEPAPEPKQEPTPEPQAEKQPEAPAESPASTVAAKDDAVSEAAAPVTAPAAAEAAADPGVTAAEKTALTEKPIEVREEAGATPTESAAATPVAEATSAGQPDPAMQVNRARPTPHPALQAASAGTRVERAERAEPTASHAANPVKHDTLKPVVDEILSLLRQRHRAQEMPEFTLNRFLAILAQIGVFVCFVMAIWNGIAALPASEKLWWLQSLMLYRGIMWMLGAVALQVMVVSLNHNQRQR